MKGHFYNEHGVPVPKSEIEFSGDLNSCVSEALEMFDDHNVEVKEVSASWALLSLNIRVATKSSKGITFNGRLLICD